MEFLSIIRLSVQCWYCVKTIVFIVKLFTPSARALQFFLLEIPTVIPSLRALNTANEKIAVSTAIAVYFGNDTG